MLFRTLLYGPPGAGKTATAVSSFWDWKAGKQIRNGRVLFFGQEDNSALGIPEELTRRFASVATSPLDFIKEFREYTMAAVKAAREPNAPEVYVLDGFTEWNAIFMQAKGGTGFDGWNDLKHETLSLVQSFSPKVLNAYIIGTAAVDRYKSGTLDKKTGKVVGQDDAWLENMKYLPAMQGWFRENLARYFDLVLYIEQGQGFNESTHTVRMVPNDTCMIKNIWEHRWKAAKNPDKLVNPVFDDILACIERCKGQPST